MMLWAKRSIVGLFDFALTAWAWLVTLAFDRRLPTYYRYLTAGTAMGVRKQPLRGADIIVHLRRHMPRTIWELGSGSSTGVFASYAATRGASAVALEHSEQWREVTIDALERSQLATGCLDVVHSPARQDDRGVSYTAPMPDGVDFVYVDGPPTRDPEGRMLPCVDVPEALDRGVRPAVILVDGRDPTVAVLREHPVVRAEYDIKIARGSRHVELPSWRDRLRFRPHHVLTHRTVERRRRRVAGLIGNR